MGEVSILYFSSNADRAAEPLLKIDYSQIADVFVDKFGRNRRLVIEGVDGSHESFTIHRGRGIDAESMEAAAQLAKSRLQPAAGK